MNTFATTSSASRSALRSHARKLGTPRGSIGAFVVLAIVAAAAASAGAFGTFNSTVSDTHSVASGTVVIALGAHGAQTNRLDVPATNVAPGDTIERSVDLLNTGTLDLADIVLTTTAPVTTSLLDTDATNGLQMQIDNCATAWTEAWSSPAYTYTCSGGSTSVLAQRAVIGSALALTNLTALTAGDTDHLLLTLTLPSTTDNTFQGLSSTIDYSFTGTQRAGTNR
jgi:spore coat-associated protein N